MRLRVFAFLGERVALRLCGSAPLRFLGGSMRSVNLLCRGGSRVGGSLRCLRYLRFLRASGSVFICVNLWLLGVLRIAILTSGGVDSSVALHLLAREGRHDLTAFYLKIWLEEDRAEFNNTRFRFYERHARGGAASAAASGRRPIRDPRPGC